MKIDARITILGSEHGVEIEIEDRLSSRTFVKVSLTPEQFVQAAMGRLACQKCDCEVYQLDRVGKKMEMDTLRFEMPKMDWKVREESAYRIALEKCPEGWEPDQCFGSKGSFYRDGETEMAKCTIRRWVEIS